MLVNILVVTKANTYGQGSEIIDSLKTELKNSKLSDEERLLLFHKLSFETNLSPDERLLYSDSLLILGKELDNKRAQVKGHLHKGFAFYDLSNYPRDIEESLKALDLAISIEHNVTALIYSHLGNSFLKMNDYKQAENYLLKALDEQLRSNPKDYPALFNLYFNLSEFYLNTEELTSAFDYLQKSIEYFEKADSPGLTTRAPYLKGNLGLYHLKQGDYKLAEPLLQEGAKSLSSWNKESALGYYNHLIDLAQLINDTEKIKYYTNRAGEMAISVKESTELSKYYYNLYEIANSENNFPSALSNYKTYHAYRDSALNLSSVQKVANLQNELELSNKQKELESEQFKAKQQKTRFYISVMLSILLIVLIVGMFNRIRYVRKTSSIIEEEKERSDQLLKNILPDETADELKAFGKVTAKQFDSVTVLFADFCGFTKHTSKMGPQELVERVDFYFSKFDEIMEKYDLEKIKTIGDAYMCAGGLPFPSHDHAMRMVMAAFEMLEFAQQFKDEDPDDPTRFDIRIGINTGPVIAGVVGTKKFVYDIWGDTVNIASRMESNSQAGQINISADTYQLIKNQLDCTYRGEVDVKNKGMMKMYFINPLNKLQKENLYKNQRVTA
ncbi:adenylate/guanylate cyclase domain-containing protein [Robertkochia marina]|nr:adenylate/guanylate cyclase domain-containing protein [Robertkochia marina]